MLDVRGEGGGSDGGSAGGADGGAGGIGGGEGGKMDRRPYTLSLARGPAEHTDRCRKRSTAPPATADVR